MKRDNLNTINERDIDLLLDSYSKIEIQVPASLQNKVMNRIERLEQKETNYLDNIINSIQKLFRSYRTPALAFSLSLIIILLLSIGTVTTVLLTKSKSKSNINMTQTINPENEQSITAKVSVVKNTYGNDNEEASILVNGKAFKGEIDELLTRIESKDTIKIEVKKGAVKIEIDKGNHMIAYEDSVLKLSRYINDAVFGISIHCYLKQGEIDITYNKKTASQDVAYHIETPSAKVMPGNNSEFNLSVFENKDSVLWVKQGEIKTYSNLKWNTEMTNNDKTLLNKYVNIPTLLQEGDSDIFVMKDVINHSKYINDHYKRIIDKYIIASQ